MHLAEFLDSPQLTRRQALGLAAVTGAALVAGAAVGYEEHSDRPSDAAKFAGNVIFGHGQDPSAARIDDRIYYAAAAGHTIHIAGANSVPDLAKVNIHSRAQRVWRSSNNDIGHDTKVWAPKIFTGPEGVTIYGSTFNDDVDGHQRIFAVGADSIDQGLNLGFIFQGFMNTCPNWAIDGSRFSYRGDSFFVWSGKNVPGGPANQHICIAPMESPYRLGKERSIISKPMHTWEYFGWQQGINEAPLAFVPPHEAAPPRVIFSAAGSWTERYCLGQLALVGDDPLNPGHWHKDPQPVFQQIPYIYGPGAHSIVEDKDHLWLLYSNKISSDHNWSREVRAQTISLDQEGLPVIDRPRYTFGPSLFHDAPA